MDPPMATRRKLQTARQYVDESLEEFLERERRLILDSFEGMLDDVIFGEDCEQVLHDGCKLFESCQWILS